MDSASLSLESLLIHKQSSLIPTEEALLDALLADRGIRIQTLNLHHLALAKSNQPFREAIIRADKVTADGWPVHAAYVALDSRTDRVTGSHLVQAIFHDERSTSRTFGLLGASPDVGDDFGAIVRSRGRRLVFADHRPRIEWEPNEIATRLNEAKVDVLFVAVTPPFGEIFASHLMDCGFAGNIIAVGGSIDMITGKVKTCPPVLQKLKLEWAFRLIQQPRRLASRYFLQCVPVMLFDVLPLLAMKRLGRPRRRIAIDALK